MSSVDLAPGVYRWRELVEHGKRALTGLVDAPDSEARFLVEHVSGFDRTELAVASGEHATAREVGRLVAMLERRAKGEPLQYVLGRWSFRGIELLVDRRVLIPRPETEVVTEVALEEAVFLGARRDPGGDPWAAGATKFITADLGTGSGAIALSLAHELIDAQVWATDISVDALDVASANLVSIGLAATRVRLSEGSWFEALPGELRGEVGLLVSNPPYVAAGEELPAEVSGHEPHGALVSGPSGLESLATLIEQGREWLASPGTLVCEIAPHQAELLTDLARRCGYAEVQVRPDLAGRPRVLIARRR